MSVKILLKKLENYGFRGIPLQLIQSYLTDRRQYTMMNGTKSELNKVKCGVPQGSTLGPLLWGVFRGGHGAKAPPLGRQDSIIIVE